MSRPIVRLADTNGCIQPRAFDLAGCQRYRWKGAREVDVTEKTPTLRQSSLRDVESIETTLRDAVAESEKALGPVHPDTLNHLNNLAIHYVESGSYAAAEPLLRRVLDARHGTLGPEHPDTLASVSNLAVLLHRRGDFPTAERLCRRALEAQQRLLGAEHPDTLASIVNLASLLEGQGDSSSAERLLRDAGVSERGAGTRPSRNAYQPQSPGRAARSE